MVVAITANDLSAVVLALASVVSIFGRVCLALSCGEDYLAIVWISDRLWAYTLHVFGSKATHGTFVNILNQSRDKGSER